jgi:hypothetical protein
LAFKSRGTSDTEAHGRLPAAGLFRLQAGSRRLRRLRARRKRQLDDKCDAFTDLMPEDLSLMQIDDRLADVET